MASVYARDIISASHAERYPGGWTSPNSSVKDSSSSFLSSFGGVSGKGPDDQYGGNAVKLLPAISLGGMDRPLPPRSGGYGYGGRPKSVDLVTPVNFI